MTFRKLLFILVIGITTAPLLAQTATWNGGTGDWNNASNWDLNVIPDARVHVIIENGTVTIPSNFTATAKSVEVQQNSQLEIADNSSLTIRNVLTGHSIFVDNSSDLTVQGQLIVNNHEVSNSNALRVEGGMRVGNSGDIQILNTIDGIGAILVDANATVRNEGKISIIDNFDHHAFRVEGRLDNYGTIIINNTSNHGLFLSPSGGRIDNYGLMNFSNIGSSAIVCSGSLFLNRNSGRIIANNVNGGVLIDTGGVFRLRNQSSLDISDALNNAIYNNGTFTTTINTDIFIKSAGNSGIWTSGNTILRGRTYIKSAYFGLQLDSGQVIVRDVLEIVDTEQTAIFLPDGNATFEASAQIIIDHTGYGITYGNQITGNYSLTNKGSIDIRHADYQGIRIHGGSFDNLPTGVIDIYHIDGPAILIDNGGSSTNEGWIDIYDVSSAVSCFGSMTNKGNGLIQAGAFSWTGMTVGGYFENNDAIIDLDGQANSSGISLTGIGDLVNTNCAYINVEDRISLDGNGGYFSNFAFLEYSSNSDITNASHFYNAGIISDYYGVLNSNNFLSSANDAAIIKPIQGPLSVAELDVLEVSPFSNSSFDNWYTTKTGSVSAGVYTGVNSNDFYHNTNADNRSVLWVECNLAGSNCPTRMPVHILDAAPLQQQPTTVAKTPEHALKMGMTNEEIRLFPNPVSDILQVQSDTPIQQLIIRDSQGKLIKTISNAFDAIPVADLPNGIYWIVIQTDQGRVTRKLSINS